MYIRRQLHVQHCYLSVKYVFCSTFSILAHYFFEAVFGGNRIEFSTFHIEFRAAVGRPVFGEFLRREMVILWRMFPYNESSNDRLYGACNGGNNMAAWIVILCLKTEISSHRAAVRHVYTMGHLFTTSLYCYCRIDRLRHENGNDERLIRNTALCCSSRTGTFLRYVDRRVLVWHQVIFSAFEFVSREDCGSFLFLS